MADVDFYDLADSEAVVALLFIVSVILCFHGWAIRLVSVAEKDLVVMSAFYSLCPIRFDFPEFNGFLACDDLVKP